jgi:CHAD domain-containing protein
VVDLGSFTKVTIAKLAPKKLQLLRRSLQKIEGPESAQQLHQARLAAKRLRYTCELYSLAESTEARKLQTVLGRLHDVVVMRALLSSAIYRIAQGNSPVEIQWSLQRTAAPQVVLTFTNFGDFPTCRKLLLRLAAQERKFFMQLKQLL